MELWVRSQSRVLLEKAEMIKVGTTDNGKTYSIIVNNDYVYADYKTKERALEVLDEIHSCIQTNELFDIYSKLGTFSDDFNKKYNLVPVYQMPKE